MRQPVFNADKFISFNLKTGSISSLGEESLALIPFEILSTLEPSAALAEAAQKWGEIHGDQLAAYVRRSGRPVGMEALADHLGGTFAIFGMGKMNVEIRGQALMFRADLHGGEASSGQLALYGEFIAGYLKAVSDRSFEVLSLGIHLGEQLFWAGNRDAVRQVKKWIDQGTEPLAAVERLAQGGVS